MHVAMMEQVMSIQSEEDTRTFHIPAARQVHAPMDVFVRGVVRGDGQGSTRNDGKQFPSAEECKTHGHRDDQRPNEYERRPIPPGHGDGLLVLVIDEMIGVICLEDIVMDQGMPFEWVAELSERSMHDEPM